MTAKLNNDANTTNTNTITKQNNFEENLTQEKHDYISDNTSDHSCDTLMSQALTENYTICKEDPFKKVKFLKDYTKGRSHFKQVTLETYIELMYDGKTWAEYLKDKVIRPMFDIDLDTNSSDPTMSDLELDDFLKRHLKVLCELCKHVYHINIDINTDFAISEAHGFDEIKGIYKYSFHVVITRVALSKWGRLKDILEQNKLTKQYEKGYYFDTSVYKESDQVWRNIGMIKPDHTKLNNPRVLKPLTYKEHDDLLYHFPSFLFGSETPLPTPTNMIFMSYDEPSPTPTKVTCPKSNDDLVATDPKNNQWEKADINLNSNLEKEISTNIYEVITHYDGHDNVKYDYYRIEKKNSEFRLGTYWKSNGCKRVCPSNIQHEHGKNNFCVNLNLMNGDISYLCLSDSKACFHKPKTISQMPKEIIDGVINDINDQSDTNVDFHKNDITWDSVCAALCERNKNKSKKRADDIRPDFDLQRYKDRIESMFKGLDIKDFSIMNNKCDTRYLCYTCNNVKCINNKYHPLSSDSSKFSIKVDEDDLNSLYYQCTATCEPKFIGYLDNYVIIEHETLRLCNKYLTNVKNKFDPYECEELVKEIALLDYNEELQQIFFKYISKWWTYVKHGDRFSLIRSDYEGSRIFIDYDITKSEKANVTFDFLDNYRPENTGRTWNIVDQWYLKKNKEYKTKIVWAPNGCCKHEFNTFVEPSYIHMAKVSIDDMDTESQINGQNGVVVINQHILEVMCNGSKKTFELWTNWMAHQVQNGVNRKFNCNTLVPLFYGPRGIGKGLLVIEFIAKFLFGGVNQHRRWCQIQTVEELKSKFNANTVKKLFIVFDDLDTYEKEKKIWATLRNLYGNTTQRAEMKFMDSIMIDHVTNYIGLSNDINCTRVASDERNSWLIPCASKVSREHIDNLLTCINENTALHWLHWLLKKDISDYNPFDFTKSIHKNSLFKEMQQKNIPPLCLFLQQMVETNDDSSDTIQINPTDFTDAYETYLRSLQLTTHEYNEYTISKMAMKSHLRKYISVATRKGTCGVRYYEF